MRTLIPALVAAAWLLTGCGGKPGGSDPAAAPIALASLQGFWTGPISTNLGGADKARVVVLEDGRAWLFLHDSSISSEPLVGIATATLSVSGDSFTGAGTRYPASGVSLAAVGVSGDGPVSGNMDIAVTSGSDPVSTLNLAYEVRYEVAALQADVVADWHFTKEAGTIDATWSIASGGVLSGTSSLGCTYSGLVVPHAEPAAVFDVSVAEDCAGTVKQLTGIGKLNTAKSFLTFGLTSTGGAQAEAFAAAKL